mmetsp:Transcript_53569/g.125392  ORF Transcript_53569/g.125392 Transcript_53569/m.125392 type:complete len:229 (-) Transcript_53569:274-960(-)
MTHFMPMSFTWPVVTSPVKAPSAVLLTFWTPSITADPLPSTFWAWWMCGVGGNITASTFEEMLKPLKASSKSLTDFNVPLHFQLPPTTGFLNIPLAGQPIVRKASPAYEHREPSSSSMRSSWLYFESRSLLHGAPVLISPVRRPTTKSAMKESSVSPDLCETMMPQPANWDIIAASIDSVIEPIWLIFISRALHALTSRAFCTRLGFVTSKSSPTICMESPTSAWNLV